MNRPREMLDDLQTPRTASRASNPAHFRHRWLPLAVAASALTLAFFGVRVLRLNDGDHPLLYALIVSACGFAILLVSYLAGRQRNENMLRMISERLSRQNSALRELSRQTALSHANLDDELRKLTHQSSRTLDVERVSIWLLDNDHRELVCQCLYQSREQQYSRGMSLKASDFPRYFATLHEGRGFAADDACNDPRTSEFTQTYLRPLRIGAMLDVPIRVDNQLVGVVCHEHIGGTRHWSEEEQAFAASIGDLTSLAYESVRRHDVEQKLQQLNIELEDTVAARTEELRDANERLREMDLLKSRYLDSIADQLQKTVAEFDHIKHHDPLTGLANRPFFNDLLELALSQARQKGQKVAVMLLDIDAFKLINDSLGHALGDALLVQLAERMQEALPDKDKVARIGSDEFAILLHNVDDQEALAKLAQRLLYAMATPTNLHPDMLSVTASIGIALSPDDGSDRHSLIRAADTAMFTAKAQGRNRYCFHTPEMSARANELHSIEQGLHRALEHDLLSVHYQPQINLTDGTLHGVEALVRWNHPSRGTISPATFIPVAETCGLIGEIGRWVLQAACRECMSWLPAMPPHVRLAVNVSARQLITEDFVEQVREILARTGFPPERLELEVTESTLQVVETSTRLLNEVRTLGIRIAIDDFGTGYSSLSVLKALPIDQIKIDKSFINDIPDDANDIAIVEAIIAMSHTLGRSVVAEGVETEAQLAILKRLGCETGQGYLFSKPVPQAALIEWLANTPNT